MSMSDSGFREESVDCVSFVSRAPVRTQVSNSRDSSPVVFLTTALSDSSSPGESLYSTQGTDVEDRSRTLVGAIREGLGTVTTVFMTVPRTSVYLFNRKGVRTP